MRKKVTLAYITNDKERKVSFLKRKTGFLKKLTELCTLCDVEACCILYSPYETGPVVWPNTEVVHAVFERFKTVSPLERIKKTVDQEGYNKMRINKIRDQWYKIHKENKRKKLELYMFQVIACKMTLDCFDIRDAAVINFVIKQWLRNLEVQINKLQEGTSDGAGGSISHKAAADGPDVVAGVPAMSEAEAAADVAATMEALTPLIPSLDLSTSLGVYDTINNTTLCQDDINNWDYSYAWNDLMINNNNNFISNYGASNDGRFSVLGDGIAWNDKFMGCDVGDSDDHGVGDCGSDGQDDDDADCSSSGDDDPGEEDGDEGNEDGEGRET